MTKSTAPASAPAAPPVVATQTGAVAAAALAPEVKMSLADFCARLSETVRRPELIGAFEHVERKAGRKQATEAEFRARYDEFVNKPV
jgi:hypothetical protein